MTKTQQVQKSKALQFHFPLRRESEVEGLLYFGPKIQGLQLGIIEIAGDDIDPQTYYYPVLAHTGTSLWHIPASDNSCWWLLGLDNGYLGYTVYEEAESLISQYKRLPRAVLKELQACEDSQSLSEVNA